MGRDQAQSPRSETAAAPNTQPKRNPKRRETAARSFSGAPSVKRIARASRQDAPELHELIDAASRGHGIPAIDLPLKILIREDGKRKVWVSYNSPEYLQPRHNIAPALIQNIAGLEGLAVAVAK